ncbi:MAG: glycoside hydrolase family 26 protein [Dehalococcoidia bacterium]
MTNLPKLPRRAFLGGLAATGVAAILGRMLDRSASAAPVPPVLFGAWQPGAPWDGSSRSLENIDALEARLGRRLDIAHWYAGWAYAPRPDVELIRAVTARGALPLITWEPWDYAQGPEQPRYALDRIARGDFDAYVDTWADDLATLGTPVYLRFAHEMDGDGYPWSVSRNGNTPDAYVRAWRHVVGRVRERAGNVRFVWCPNVTWEGSPRVPYAAVFPGVEHVDVLGLDGYNGGRDVDWGGWQSFPAIVDVSLAALAPLSAQDVWICEVGSAEAGGSKPQWIAEMWAALRERPRITGLVWFNESREADWRIESSAGSLAAMRDGLAALDTGRW